MTRAPGSPNFWIVTNHDYVRYTRLEAAIAEKDRLYDLYGGKRRFHVIRCKGVTSSPASRVQAAMLDALLASRKIIAEDLDALLEARCLLDSELRPRRDTLEPEHVAAVEELEAILDRIDAALALAGETPLVPDEIAERQRPAVAETEGAAA